MKETKYGFSKKVNLNFDQALEKVKTELQNQGFGVVSEIAMHQTLKNKLNVDFKPYVILGACNPPNAYKALQAEEQIGLLLPCNVIVYNNAQNETIVAAINPVAVMASTENAVVDQVAQDILKKLQTVIENL